jgi:hypothetical protein
MASNEISDQLYGTYDGGYVNPSLTYLGSKHVYTPVVNMCDQIPNIVINVPDINITELADRIPEDQIPEVIIPPICGQSELKPKKSVWQVSYTIGSQWTNAHVIATNMNEVIVLCSQNGIAEDSIRTMHRLESSLVLY